VLVNDRARRIFNVASRAWSSLLGANNQGFFGLPNTLVQSGPIEAWVYHSQTQERVNTTAHFPCFHIQITSTFKIIFSSKHQQVWEKNFRFQSDVDSDHRMRQKWEMKWNEKWGYLCKPLSYHIHIGSWKIS